MTDASEILLRLTLTPGIGSRSVAKLLGVFGTPQAVWSARKSQWANEVHLDPALHGQLHGGEVESEAKQVRRRCAELGIQLLFLGEPDYPPALAAIHDPPAVLYLLGRLPPPHLQERCVALIGTRKPSDDGLAFAYRLAAELSAAGVVIVSGLAMGIDAEAHRAVVAGGGVGVGVLPGGLDAVHPPANRRLAEQLLQKGCLLSECPPGGSLNRGSFVARNRIISGLSQVVAVVEAGERSGALHTVGFAIDQGRTVFVMPGRPSDPRVAGILPLLRDGAHPLLGSADLLDEFGLVHRRSGPRSGLPELGNVGALFRQGGATFDDLLAASGASAPDLLAALGKLELDGRVRRGADGRYYLLSG